MTKRLADVTLDNLDDLAESCRSCALWELDPVASQRVCADGSAALEKEAWVSDTLLEWGTCGQIAYVDGIPAGHVLYAPAAYVPRSSAFATSPVGPDAVLFVTARVSDDHAGAGLGRMLVQGLARDLVRRGVRAIEAFGRTSAQSDSVDARCLIPAEFLQATGFKIVRAHPITPRLRLDVRSIATWREDAGYAWDRLFATVHSPSLVR